MEGQEPPERESKICLAHLDEVLRRDLEHWADGLKVIRAHWVAGWKAYRGLMVQVALH
jgi:hypothetical protein